MDEKPPTPYELATLASKICPDLCVDDPAGAIKVVQQLLSQARVSQWKEVERERTNEERATVRFGDWESSVKYITHEQRLERALQRFRKFLKEFGRLPDWIELAACKREGFTDYEESWFEQFYGKWSKEKPKRKKGKQGRRKSASDGRLRTNLIKLVPTKPPKAA